MFQKIHCTQGRHMKSESLSSQAAGHLQNAISEDESYKQAARCILLFYKYTDFFFFFKSSLSLVSLYMRMVC